MKTKSYLFATVASTLVLLLVLPVLKNPIWVLTSIMPFLALTTISISVGGLVAETYTIARSSATANNAKRYFMSLVCSLLFLAIVAPLIHSSDGFVGLGTALVLLVLSLALGGLAAEALFSLFPKSSELRAKPQLDTTKHHIENLHLATDIELLLEGLGTKLDTAIEELRQELVISARQQACKATELHSATPTSDRVVDVLVGRARAGEK